MSIPNQICILLVSASLCLSGCFTAGKYRAYSGSKRPKDRIAVLEGYHHVYPYGVGFYETWVVIIGVSGGGHYDPKRTTVVELLPGEHCVGVRWWTGGQFWLGPGPLIYAPPSDDSARQSPSFRYASGRYMEIATNVGGGDKQEICFTALAGRQYQIKHNKQQRADQVGELHWFWIIDKADGSIVAGQPPPDGMVDPNDLAEPVPRDQPAPVGPPPRL